MWTQFDCSCVGRSAPALGQHQTTVVLQYMDMEKGRCNMCENLSPALGSTHIHSAITKRLSNQHYQKSPLPTFANEKYPVIRVPERASIFTLHILFERRRLVSVLSQCQESSNRLRSGNSWYIGSSFYYYFCTFSERQENRTRNDGRGNYGVWHLSYVHVIL